jgi:hypothetical protein
VLPRGWQPCCSVFEDHTKACYFDVRYEWSSQHGWMNLIAPSAGGGGIVMSFCPHCGIKLFDPSKKVPKHLQMAETLLQMPAATTYVWVEQAKRNGLFRMIEEAQRAAKHDLLVELGVELRNTTEGWPSEEGLRAIMSYIDKWAKRLSARAQELKR